MGRFFCNDTPYEFWERQMQQPPNYRPRGYGSQIVSELEWRDRGS